MKHLLCLFLTLTTVSSAFSLGEAEMLKRLAAFQLKDIGKTASAEKIDFLYRIHEFPAHEHLKRTVIVLYEIKIIAPPGRDYEGSLRLMVSLPDYSVVQEEMPLKNEQILAIGRIFALTEIFDLPPKDYAETSFRNPDLGPGLHSGEWRFEAFDRAKQIHRLVDRFRRDDSSGDRVMTELRKVADPLIKKISEQLETWEKAHGAAAAPSPSGH